ncbi:putative DNA primase/helicase [Bradyrhizobium barranii subsp. barranii]|uniref:DUF7146 domain-containing protein n=1 Tax=Bradyrhizobium TaxID=374 RepID=UPI001BABCF7E|nr:MULTISPECIES: toprim domain-containing protein [Bradyrhizobium]MBR0879654.1 toprim domain-containing protein [Bradyrhizobium liaoningense]MCP1778791.1 hypothetical protein [Bradyrhizobium japonicum]MCP1958211.1 hypothetical protein [Bradyrhizobium japonicum]
MTAEQLAIALGARRSGRQFKCRCVAHEDKNPSMLIFDGRSAVQVRCMSGCEPADIIAVLKSRGLWEGSEHQDDTSRKVSTAELPKVSHETQQRERALLRLRGIARETFDAAVGIEGTLAERYFERRDLLSVARMISDIRFHPRCPHEQFRQPAVVVAMRSFTTNAVMAVQRIFLTRDARKDGVPMMLGSAGGSAMKLQQLQDGRLHITEGLETGLATIAMDHGPTWALGSTSLMRSFPVLADVRELFIWADHDPIDPRTGKRPGTDAALVCEGRWSAAGKAVEIYQSRTEGWDQADVWSARCGRL